MLTMYEWIFLAIVLLPAMLLVLLYRQALRVQATKWLFNEDQAKLERTILEVVREQPDILTARLTMIVEERLNLPCHSARVLTAVDRLDRNGCLSQPTRFGLDLAGERRILPYCQLTSKGEKRLLAT